MALFSHGSVEQFAKDYDQSVLSLEGSLAIWRALDQRFWIAAVLTELGEVRFFQGDRTQARELHEEALSIYRDLGDRAAIALILH